MIEQSRIFHQCLGYKTDKIINKPIFYYHVPKCAGTTFCNLMSFLFKKNFRMRGPLFKNNDKGGVTGYDNFIKNQQNINNSPIDFLYGHVPFEIYKNFNNNYLNITILRDPLERCISHYNWSIVKGYIKENDDLEKLFTKNIIPKNTIVNQFSGIGIKENNADHSLNLAIKNLENKIDIICDINDIYNLLNYCVSHFNLPNLFFQNQQVLINKKKLPQNKIDIIKYYNKMDNELYAYIKKNKIIKKFKFNKSKKRNSDVYLFSSPYLLLDNKKTLLINTEKLKKTRVYLNKNKYKIIVH